MKAISISTGSNHTFGKNKEGNPKLLKQNETLYNYKYFCVDTVKFNHNIISSTYIKKLLSIGEIEKANKILMSNFSLEGKVIHGEGLAKNLGFPTANIKYPEKITKIPYGVYKILVNNTPAILNWGIKPTFRNKEETLEIHIPNYNKNLYSKNLKFEIIKKIRDEQKFKDIESLQAQIKKDIEECLK